MLSCACQNNGTLVGSKVVLALFLFLKENSFYIHTHRISTTNIPIILVQNVDFKCIEDLLANSDKAELTISLDDKEIRNTKVITKIRI